MHTVDVNENGGLIFIFVFAVIIKTFRARNKKILEVSNEKLFVVVILLFSIWVKMNEWKNVPEPNSLGKQINRSKMNEIKERKKNIR